MSEFIDIKNEYRILKTLLEDTPFYEKDGQKFIDNKDSPEKEKFFNQMMRLTMLEILYSDNMELPENIINGSKKITEQQFKSDCDKYKMTYYKHLTKSI